MIVYNLACPAGHKFEGWFASIGAFENQRQRHLLSCPVCNSAEITRLPSAPYVNTGGSTVVTGGDSLPAAEPPAEALSERLAMMTMMLRQLAERSEDVGESFAEEARRIYYGESKQRNIKGMADREEIESLLEEDIVVLPLPAPRDKLH